MKKKTKFKEVDRVIDYDCFTLCILKEETGLLDD